MMNFSEKTDKRSEQLKRRSERCCCRYCGGTLEIKSILFSDFIEARVELYCPNCDRIEFGTEPEIYASAQYFAEVMNYNCYPELDNNENTKRMTVARLCDIMAWQDKHLGIIDDDGFKIDVNKPDLLLNNGSLFNDNDLTE